jgi:hypothetical protein
LLRRTGEACRRTGDIDLAIGLFEHASTLLQSPGTKVAPFERLALLIARASLLQGRGDLDEALGIRREELPVIERLGGRDLAVGRANLAITLLTRNTPGDREEARGLLCLALADARQMQLAEAAQIEAILKQTGLSCD